MSWLLIGIFLAMHELHFYVHGRRVDLLSERVDLLSRRIERLKQLQPEAP